MMIFAVPYRAVLIGAGVPRWHGDIKLIFPEHDIVVWRVWSIGCMAGTSRSVRLEGVIPGGWYTSIPAPVIPIQKSVCASGRSRSASHRRLSKRSHKR
jgi:hypothetical protein